MTRITTGFEIRESRTDRGERRWKVHELPSGLCISIAEDTRDGAERLRSMHERNLATGRYPR